MRINIYNFRKTRFLVGFFIVSLIVGCTLRDDLPKANSKADTVPPEANFSYASSQEDFRTIIFTNLSNEATIFAWDFGGGNTSNEVDPTFTFEDGEGTYPVTLTASDALGAVSTTTIDVIVVEGPFQPIILEPGFEDNTLPGGGGDGRDSWRNSDLGGVIQITGSPVTFGDQGAKLPLL
jgi:PKD repeat protein